MEFASRKWLILKSMFLVVLDEEKKKNRLKKEKRQQGRRTPYRVFYKLNHTKVSWRVKESFLGKNESGAVPISLQNNRERIAED